jgi:alpha-mannosidase
MRKYTGHLVGHAHIDFQWLWEWPETVQVCHDTFSQAIKFMDEFASQHFTFSQSSAALYATTEEHYPDLFKRMQEKVAAGQWEIVGGRVCEGDEHMISPESHARHFLYGQRYFRERFNGKDAIVGWEPDTFGHTWQFPQILKLGGCKYFYFCRGGHGKPLFWWEGLDGTKVLSFEEPATGGWYNGDVQMNRFDRLFSFADTTGSKEMLWVYGVGNHGGGPTRENIEAANNFSKIPFLPNVKFSTATEFFKQLEKQDISKIPTVNTELNTTNSSGFFGVYTTHSDIKRWNRDAEAITESAEAIAAFASRYGFEYPQKEFRRNWEEITWNHHHDTLPGTSIHPSYNKSEAMFKRTIESSRKIADEAMKVLASKIKSDGDGTLVFNPTGSPQQEVPAYGYRILKSDSPATRSRVKSAGKSYTIENAGYRVTFDAERGVVTSVLDKKSKFEGIAPAAAGTGWKSTGRSPTA